LTGNSVVIVPLNSPGGSTLPH